MSFNALQISKPDPAQRDTECNLASLDIADLTDGDVIVDIEYSTINYKDALAIAGKAPIIRNFPLVPGIDFSGTVAESTHSDWKAGDKVILNGWGVGETHCGGLAQKARVNGDWLIALPEKFTTRDAMSIGTAGYTAMLCVMALRDHGIAPKNGEILVTGANGGVGSFAIAILSNLGYEVVASTGRPENMEYLSKLGAISSIHRNELSEPGKPLGKERWAGVIDCVGSHTLANACATTKYNGVVAACGLAQGMDLPATVAPFILRGVTLAGVESVRVPIPKRQSAWSLLAEHLDLELLEEMTTEIGLSEAITVAGTLLAGKIKGRVIVDVNK